MNRSYVFLLEIAFLASISAWKNETKLRLLTRSFPLDPAI